MRNGWFNLVLTLCAVRGFWQDYGGYEKAKLSWEGLAEGGRQGLTPADP